MTSTCGVVEGLFIAPAGGAYLVGVAGVRVLAQGLEGDRYALGRGSFSRWPGPGREVTLVESEVLDAVLAEAGLDLHAGRSRRNVVTRGVRLAGLMNRRFRLGTALLFGDRPADPCAVLERRIGPGLMAALKGRGGLRASVVSEGEVRVGDAVGLVEKEGRHP